jgi:hypothetical protein
MPSLVAVYIGCLATLPQNSSSLWQVVDDYLTFSCFSFPVILPARPGQDKTETIQGYPRLQQSPGHQPQDLPSVSESSSLLWYEGQLQQGNSQL